MYCDREYPEHEKLRAIKDQSQTIGSFLEWLNEQGVHLASYHKHTPHCYEDEEPGNPRDLICYASEETLYDVGKTTERILAQYFEIDLEKLEEEKQDMLEDLRRTNEELARREKEKK